MLIGKGKVWKATTKARGHVIYIPTDVTTDSAYPFELREEVRVYIDRENNRLIIAKRKPT